MSKEEMIAYLENIGIVVHEESWGQFDLIDEKDPNFPSRLEPPSGEQVWTGGGGWTKKEMRKLVEGLKSK